MKTSSIAYRVADFLKQYAPFEFIEQGDLLTLAGTGRVRFHEEDEYLFREGELRGPYIYVVQKGTVHVVSGKDESEELVDMRGPGDLVGISVFLDETRYEHTARTMTETIVYALRWDAFKPLVQKYPAVARYFAAYFSVRPSSYSNSSGSGNETYVRPVVEESPNVWVRLAMPIAERSRERLITCSPGTAVHLAARQMQVDFQEALIVANEEGLPLGIITETDFCNRVATGEVSVNAPVEALMTSPVKTVPAGMDVGAILLTMVQHKLRHLCVTEDGTPHSRVIGLIAERDIQLLHGRLPTYLTKEIRSASDLAALRKMRMRADDLLLTFLEERLPWDWIAEFIAEIDRAVHGRVLQLTEIELVQSGLYSPNLPYAWMAVGAEGRGERLLPVNQEHVLVYADPEPDAEKGVKHWFDLLATTATENLIAVGYQTRPQSVRCSDPRYCLSLSAWRAQFELWIAHPVETEFIPLRSLLDMRKIAGSPFVARCLQEAVHECIERNPHFYSVLANESLRALPPVTIFQNSVVDQEGILWNCIDTRKHLLDPLADQARALALHAGLKSHVSTRARFRALAEHYADRRDVYLEAAEACRIALVHQALAGLRNNNDGQFILPSELSKVDLEILKSAFRSVVDIYDETSAVFQLSRDVVHAG